MNKLKCGTHRTVRKQRWSYKSHGHIKLPVNYRTYTQDKSQGFGRGSNPTPLGRGDTDAIAKKKKILLPNVNMQAFLGELLPTRWDYEGYWNYRLP